jgi:hypothetical protein
MWLQHDHPCLSRRRSLHIASLAGLRPVPPRRHQILTAWPPRVDDPYAVMVADAPATLGQQRPFGVVVGAYLYLPAVIIVIA